VGLWLVSGLFFMSADEAILQNNDKAWQEVSVIVDKLKVAE
jgi:hypothetical protein